MKKIVTLSLAFSALIFSAQAQEQREYKKDKNKMERHEGHKGDRGHKMQDLNLSEAQKSQLKAGREEFKAKMDQLKTQNLSETQFAERRKTLMLEQKAKMESILTAEQKAQLGTKRGAFDKDATYDHKKRMQGEKKKMHGDKKMMMKEKLSLTDDQSTQLAAQRKYQKDRMLAIKNDASLSPEAKKARIKALKEEAKAQRKNILTAAQMQKMEEMKKEHKNKNPKRTRK